MIGIIISPIAPKLGVKVVGSFIDLSSVNGRGIPIPF